MLNKNIIITDNMDWNTRKIVEASLDRWQVEGRFRVSNENDTVGIRPIRCQLFTLEAAMVYLRCLELRLAENDISRTEEDDIM